ncbi:MAG: hypothetical protein GQ557_02275 [Mycoplasmataceae bacterium]|nr:hypothetical protein [Mycoplasmataceae bacterium]
MSITNNIYANSNIGFVSACCGAGKTHALMQHIKENQQNHNHLIVLPSLDLVEQVYKNLKSMGLLDVFTITSKNTPTGKVKSSIVEFFKGYQDFGQILIITWAAYDDLPYFQNKANWKIFIDEVPQVNDFHKLDVSKNRQLITDFIELKQSINADMAQVGIKEGCQNKLKLASQSSDDGYEAFKPLYRALLSENRDVFVNPDEWAAVIEGRKTGIKSGELTFVAMLNPMQFINTTILAANFEDSLLFLWFTKFYEVNFRGNQKITNKLQYTAHEEQTGRRVKIKYFLNNQNYSKYYRDKAMGENPTVGQEIDKMAAEIFGNESFLYVVNNDYKPEFGVSDNGTRLSVKSHGLNKYQHNHNIYFNLALNYAPNQLALMKNLGFSSDQLLIANTFETIYQNTMRTSLRDSSSDEPVNIIVPDINSATHLQSLLGGGIIEQIEGFDFPEKPQKLTPVQRKNRSQYKSIIDELMQGKASFDGLLQLCTHTQKLDEYSALADMDDNQVAVTFHKSIDQYKVEDFKNYIYSTKNFISVLNNASKVVITKKDEFIMLNAGIYDGSIDTVGYRRQLNFIESHFMILDFDNGNLSPEQFEDIFWIKESKVEKRSFVICNSHSRSADEPNRFRVFMFYKSPVTSIEQHKAVYSDICKTLEKYGFDEDSACLDNACKSGNQSFYLPCINREHQEYAFFRKHGLKRTDDIKKYGIDVSAIIRTQPALSSDIIVDRKLAENDKQQESARIILSIKQMKYSRHQAFFDAAIEMRSLGLSLTEIESNCYAISGSETKMKNKVPDIMSSLKKYQVH